MTPRQIINVITKARRLLSKKEKWTRGDYATDKNGQSVDPKEKKAVCFCAIGAVERYADDASVQYELDKTARQLYPQDTLGGTYGIVRVNDHGGPRARLKVLRVFDKTIERLQKEAA